MWEEFHKLHIIVFAKLNMFITPGRRVLSALLLGFAAHAPMMGQNEQPADTLAFGLLIPATATMQRAWEIPRNPLTDSVSPDKNETELVRYGYNAFTHTNAGSQSLMGNSLSCSNCHLNAGQREKALPIVGVTQVYPQYNARSARTMDVEDRIIECYKRSIDASRLAGTKSAGETSEEELRKTKEVTGIAAYLSWLSKGVKADKELPWRGKNVIEESKRIPIGRLDTALGHTLYLDRCSNCHGEDGQGVYIGDKKAGPLWGKESWNDGAGAARIYTLAGIIRYMMPYLDPGSLTDEEAQNIAAYINFKERPEYPLKGEDYPGGKPPSDAVYYMINGKK